MWQPPHGAQHDQRSMFIGVHPLVSMLDGNIRLRWSSSLGQHFLWCLSLLALVGSSAAFTIPPARSPLVGQRRGGCIHCCDPPTAKCGPKVSRPITPVKIAAFEAAAARGAATPSVLLARPFDDGNVGSVARAMLNFGLWNLRLVAPDADAQSDEALLRASGAAPLLRAAVTHPNMASATADLQLVLATTARPRESRVPVHSPREAIRLATDAIGRGERVGFLFGSEKNGVRGCGTILSRPLAGGSPSGPPSLPRPSLSLCHGHSFPSVTPIPFPLPHTP